LKRIQAGRIVDNVFLVHAVLSHTLRKQLSIFFWDKKTLLFVIDGYVG
jgi:hypothetical protein